MVDTFGELLLGICVQRFNGMQAVSALLLILTHPLALFAAKDGSCLSARLDPQSCIKTKANKMDRFHSPRCDQNDQDTR